MNKVINLTCSYNHLRVVFYRFKDIQPQARFGECP